MARLGIVGGNVTVVVVVVVVVVVGEGQTGAAARSRIAHSLKLFEENFVFEGALLTRTIATTLTTV